MTERKAAAKAQPKPAGSDKGNTTAKSRQATKKTASKAPAKVTKTRAPWTPPMPVLDPETGKFSLPAELLRGPGRGPLSAHSKALIEALQALVEAHGKQVDLTVAAVNTRNNNETILRMTIDRANKAEAELTALERTLSLIEQAIRSFGGEFTSEWTQAAGDKFRVRSTSFQPNSDLLATIAVAANKQYSTKMAVKSSRNAKAKLHRRVVDADNKGNITLEGISTLHSSAGYVVNAAAYKQRLTPEVLNKIYADDKAGGVFALFGGLRESLDSAMGVLGTEGEASLLQAIFGRKSRAERGLQDDKYGRLFRLAAEAGKSDKISGDLPTSLTRFLGKESAFELPLHDEGHTTLGDPTPRHNIRTDDLG